MAYDSLYRSPASIQGLRLLTLPHYIVDEAFQPKALNEVPQVNPFVGLGARKPILLGNHALALSVTFVERITPPVSDVIKAGDGSTCVFTVITIEPTVEQRSIQSEVCSLCASSDVHPAVILGPGSCYRLTLGHAPDLVPDNLPTLHTSWRSLLEAVLYECRPGERLVVSASEGSTGNTTLQFSLVVNHVYNAPVCEPTSVEEESEKQLQRRTIEDDDLEEEETEDLRANASRDWNPALTRFWYRRACLLKARGTWLIHKHAQSTDKSGGTQRWHSAFACYSRALKLASLARWAKQTVAAEEGDTMIDGEESTEAWGEVDGTRIDLDQVKELDVGPSESSISSFIRLEFNLLSNLALCQLKSGSPEFGARNCTQALALAVPEKKPDTTRLDYNGLSKVDEETSINPSTDPPLVTPLDVAKVLYRRAQCHARQSNWDEAIIDLERAVGLHHDHEHSVVSNPAGLTAIEALLKQARHQLSVDRTALAERLRKRGGLL